MFFMVGVNRKEEAKRWISQAVYDLKGAEWNLKGGFFNTVCFLGQQGVEKGLKSLLYYTGVSRKKMLTHSIVELISEAKRIIPTLGEMLNEARELDLHYIPSRYPNGLPGGYPHKFYGEETGRKALEGAQKILQTILAYYHQQNFQVEEQ